MLCLLAIENNYNALQYVKEQTEELCMTAININGYALEHVKEQTEELCLAAVQNEGHAGLQQSVSSPSGILRKEDIFCGAIYN